MSLKTCHTQTRVCQFSLTVSSFTLTIAQTFIKTWRRSLVWSLVFCRRMRMIPEEKRRKREASRRSQ